MEQFVLGPFQEKWVKALEEHPEEQTSKRLGIRGQDSKMKFCCLGKALYLYNEDNKVPQTWKHNSQDAHQLLFADVLPQTSRHDDITFGFLDYSYEKIGLFSREGGFCNDSKIDGFDCLATMNDKGCTWTQIAQVIRTHPHLVFSKSV